jgi:hypothetical protein
MLSIASIMKNSATINTHTIEMYKIIELVIVKAKKLINSNETKKKDK